MAWSERRALERIQGQIAQAPLSQFTVENYIEFRDRRMVLAEASLRDRGVTEPIWRVAQNQAVTTHGVHVYANLIDFNSVLTDAGRETEASHERAMQFLHLHYGACDALIEEFGVQRVDYHGARLHAVVLEPAGPEREAERIAKALAFSAALVEMVKRTGAHYGDEFQTDVRIGIDSGPAVAINSGKRGEPDPLFIGSAANHAAKQADGDQPGIFVCARVERARSMGDITATAPSVLINEAVVTASLDLAVERRGTEKTARLHLEEAFARFSSMADEERSASGGLKPATFVFSHRQPPLSEIEFADHPPSRAIRMSVASIFADLAGFTRYIDEAMLTGRVAEAVRNLYVIRAELADVLQKDFGGRKVRYVGDCLHGVIAEGDRLRVYEADTVKQALLTAGALRSSFNLCAKLLPSLTIDGIAIGVEFGQTPIARIGQRGDNAIRCSTSKATCSSENVQALCNGHQTAIGDRAYEAGGVHVRHLFGDQKLVQDLTYEAVQLHLDVQAPAVVEGSPVQLEAHWSGD